MKTKKSIKIAKILVVPIVLFLAFLVVGAWVLEFVAIPIEGPEPHPPGGLRDPAEAWGNFQPVPIMLSDIHGLSDAQIANIKPGNIIYTDNEPTYVAIDSQRALYLDFNVASQSSIDKNDPNIGLVEISLYRVVGQVDENIMNILKSPGDSGNALVDKQFKIWAYLGVDQEALKIVWNQAYGRTNIEWNFMLPALQTYFELSKQIRTDILNANPEIWDINFVPNGYSSMTISAHNYARDVALNVHLGTKFENAGGTNQNLGAGEPVTVYVPSGMTKVFTLKTYCLNAHKGVPTMNDALSPVGVVPDDVKETMEQAFAAGTASTGESQSAVWQQTG